MNDLTQLLLALLPSGASIITITAATITLIKKYGPVINTLTLAIKNIKERQDRTEKDNKELKSSLNVLVRENELLLKQLKAEREARTGVKED